jgi:hypothetical protein
MGLQQKPRSPSGAKVSTQNNTYKILLSVTAIPVPQETTQRKAPWPGHMYYLRYAHNTAHVERSRQDTYNLTIEGQAVAKSNPQYLYIPNTLTYSTLIAQL